MGAPYTGRCLCGSVTATIGAEPVATRQCWCLQCQKIAAGGPTQNAIFPTLALELSGELAANGYVAASGNTLTHEFCPRCGTQAFAHSSARPEFRAVRLGFLAPGHGLRPQMAIWTGDAPEYAIIDPALEQFTGPPPAPALPVSND